jgi:hypothetical protein
MDGPLLLTNVKNVVAMVNYCQGFAYPCSQRCINEITPMFQENNTLFTTSTPAESNSEELQKMFKLLSTFSLHVLHLKDTNL